jgi:hypothetical protein
MKFKLVDEIYIFYSILFYSILKYEIDAIRVGVIVYNIR